MKRKPMVMGALIFTAAVVTVLIWKMVPHNDSFGQDDPLWEMIIPDETMFMDAPSVTTDPVFDVAFVYSDDKPQKVSQGNTWQEINWSLTVYPKEGATAKDVYCTLILDDWILKHSSSPDLKYMGAEKGMAGDIPSNTKGIEADMVKYIDAQTLRDPVYEQAITTPVKFMLAYDGQEKYYMIAPSKAANDT